MNRDARLLSDLERMLVETAPPGAPDPLRTDIASAASRTRQRPRWLAHLQEPPMRYQSRLAVGSPTTRLAFVVVATMTLLLALAGAVVGAASLLPSPAVVAPVQNGLIAFTSNGDIWVTDADDTDRQQLTSGPTWDSSPAWSPQGDRIAYWTQRTPANPSVLMLMDADGVNARTLRGNAVGDFVFVSDVIPPIWSPDGTHIAISVNDGSTRWIESVDVESGRHTRLAGGDWPSWSPDGTMIAYQGGPEQGEVWTMAADGSSPRRIASGGGPQWSPADDRIAYWAASGGANDVWTIAPDGSDARNVTDSPADEYWPSWSRDGSRLAYDQATGDFSSNRIIVSDADGANAVTLEGEPVTGGPPAWSPDGASVFAPLFDIQDGEYGLEVFDTSGQGPARAIAAEGHLGYDSWQAVLPR